MCLPSRLTKTSKHDDNANASDLIQLSLILNDVILAITLDAELQVIEDSKKLKLLEQQLAYVQWKKRKNRVHMKEAIQV